MRSPHESGAPQDLGGLKQSWLETTYTPEAGKWHRAAQPAMGPAPLHKEPLHSGSHPLARPHKGKPEH